MNQSQVRLGYGYTKVRKFLSQRHWVKIKVRITLGFHRVRIGE